MKLREDIQPISQLKTSPAKLISDVSRKKRPIIITQSGHARAVLQDIETYEKYKELLSLFKIIAQGEKEIRDGDIISQEDFFRDLGEKILNKK